MNNEGGTHGYKIYEELRMELEKLKQFFATGELERLNDLILEESETLEFLHISRSTLYKYRKKHGLNVIHYFGRNMYFKYQLIDIILKHLLKK